MFALQICRECRVRLSYAYFSFKSTRERHWGWKQPYQTGEELVQKQYFKLEVVAGVVWRWIATKNYAFWKKASSKDWKWNGIKKRVAFFLKNWRKKPRSTPPIILDLWNIVLNPKFFLWSGSRIFKRFSKNNESHKIFLRENSCTYRCSALLMASVWKVIRQIISLRRISV